MDQVKAIRSSTQRDSKTSFFRQAPQESGGYRGEAEATGPGKETRNTNRAGKLNGLSSQFSHVCTSDCMHKGEQSPVDRPSSSSEALLSSNQLVDNYIGPLGTEYGTGLPDRLCVGTIPTVSSTPSMLLFRTKQSDPKGVNKTPPETGDSTGGTSCGVRVPVQHIPSPQEG